MFFLLKRKSEEELKIKWKKLKENIILNEQLKAIQKELGEIDEGKDELTVFQKLLQMQKCQS